MNITNDKEFDRRYFDSVTARTTNIEQTIKLAMCFETSLYNLEQSREYLKLTVVQTLRSKVAIIHKYII